MMLLLQISLSFRLRLTVVCDAVVTDLSELQSLLLCVMLLLHICLSFRLRLTVMCDAVVTHLSELQSLCSV